MCGISGGIGVALSSKVDANVVNRLNEYQRSRGPDGEGLWQAEDDSVCLGHRRLAIIDVGATGAQPMADATGRWRLTFNGEIYNYKELRRELEALGRVFKTSSDSEVLINCVAEWGEKGVRKLRGMFAFGLWDSQEREIWLARDPFGIKPLFWGQSGDVLWFASQARALAKSAPIDATVDAAGVVGFYLWGFVPEPFTWWTGVHALPAGHLLRVRQGDRVPEPRPFHEIEEAFQSASPEPLEAADLKNALLDSVRHHFVSDVPVGLFLSAGVDSTVLAALAKEAGYKLRTFTLAFEEYRGAAQDEAPLAEETARLLGAEHQTARVSHSDFENIIDSFFAAMDQPTINGLNTYLVSWVASSVGVKVALSGLGADELTGGYSTFRDVPRLVASSQWIPFRPELADLVASIGAPFARMAKTSLKLPFALKYGGSIEAAYFLRRCLHLVEELELVLDERWRRPGLERLAERFPELNGSCSKKQDAGLPRYARVSCLEISRYMRNQPLRDTDWSSMAHSLEVRTPFLDMPLLSAMAPSIASRRPPTKRDLAACAGATGLRLMGRSKTGFTTPLAQWISELRFDRGTLRPWGDLVASKFMQA